MDDAGIVIVANAARYAVNLKICPDAVADDGLFDVAVMRCCGLAALAGLRWRPSAAGWSAGPEWNTSAVGGSRSPAPPTYLGNATANPSAACRPSSN